MFFLPSSVLYIGLPLASIKGPTFLPSSAVVEVFSTIDYKFSSEVSKAELIKVLRSLNFPALSNIATSETN